MNDVKDLAAKWSGEAEPGADPPVTADVSDATRAEMIAEARDDAEASDDQIVAGSEEEDRDAGEELELEEQTEEDAAEAAEQAAEYEEVYISSIKLPKKECMRCLHLMPSLWKKIGPQGKQVPYGKEYPCYTDDGCPANAYELVYDPFTDDMILEAVMAFRENADGDGIAKLMAEAKKLGSTITERVKTAIAEAMAASA